MNPRSAELTHRKHLIHVLLILLISLLVVACGGDEDDDSDDNNDIVVTQEPDAELTVGTEPIPDDAEITIAESRSSISTLDGIALHPSAGGFPVLISEVAYDVDEGQSVTLEDTRTRIQMAEDWSNANDLSAPSIQAGEIHLFPRYERFHYWPNVLDLTSIAALDPTLYSQILTDILVFEPAASTTRTRIETAVTAGKRVFLVRDYVNRVSASSREYHEVHYAFVVNLTDQWVSELRVHDETEQGLGNVNDPLINELTSLFAQQGDQWEMCLRGNHNRAKYSAVIVDKADDRYWIRRMHQSCTGAVPPPEKEPPILTVPPPGGNPPGGGGPGGAGPGPGGQGGAAGGPGGADGVPALEKDQRGIVEDPPWWPWGFEDEAVEDDEPALGTPAQGDGSGAAAPSCPQDAQKAQQWEQQIENQLESIRTDLAEDVEKINNMRFEWISGQTFDNPCIQEAYDNTAEQIAALQAQIDALESQLSDIHEAVDGVKNGVSEAVKILWGRDSFWDNMIHVGGTWSNITISWVPAFLSSGGQKEYIVFGDREVGAFTSSVVKAMMNGARWDDAVSEAMNNPNIYPDGYAIGDKLIQAVWVGYAECLKELYKLQFKEYMKSRWEGYSDEEQDHFLDILFDGEVVLTGSESSEAQAAESEVAGQGDDASPLRDQIDALKAQIDKLRRQFLEDMRTTCAAGAITDKLLLQHQRNLLFAFGNHCADPDGPNSVPLYFTKEMLCQAIDQLLMHPNLEPPQCQALRAYLEMLKEANQCP